MLKLGVQSRGIINEDVPESGYRRIKDSGMRCVDYNLVWSEFSDDMQLEVFYEHKRIADKYGLTFSQVHSPRIFLKDVVEELDKLIQVMEQSMLACKVLDCTKLVVHPLQIKLLVGEREEERLNKFYFESLGSLAVKHGITVCIENLFARYRGRIVEGFCSSAEDIVQMVEYVNREIGKECMGACFDVGHANALRKNLKREIMTLGKCLKCLHIHDNNGHDDDHQIPYSFGDSMSGTSTTDWSGFLLGLREIKYTGCLSFEPFKCLINTPGMLQRALLEYLCRIGEDFAKVILFESILKEYKEKDIIIFGAGKMLDVYMDSFGENYKPIFIVDNNEKIWATKKRGIDILEPLKILEIEPTNRLVIICSMYYEHITEQLKEMGVEEFIYSEEVYRMNGKPL